MHVFGTYRRHLLDGKIRDLDAATRQERERHLAALRRDIDATDRMIKNVVRSFALIDNPTEDLMRDINAQRTELRERKSALEAKLAAAEDEHQRTPNPDLLDALPNGNVQVEEICRA